LKFILLIALLFSAVSGDENLTDIDQESLQQRVSDIDRELNENSSIWLKSYSNYRLYRDLQSELQTLKNLEDRDSYKIDQVERQLKLFGEQKAPFYRLLTPSEIEESGVISNPFLIFKGLSSIQQNIVHFESYTNSAVELQEIITLLQERRDLQSILKQPNSDDDRIATFQDALLTLNRTGEIYKKRVDEVNLKIEEEIKRQAEITLYTIIVIISVIGIAFGVKFTVGHYLQDNQKVYTINKFVNFLTLNISLIILTFLYIDNVEYLITILGFASAGLAIAMKDGFMSIFGWFVIIFGGSIKVGDRIKVKMDGLEYVGDVLDISFMRITLHEDVTLTTYELNRRAGRIIFIPNNYIFTSLISNYSHYTLRTVWDGIDITITFDSNHKKASHIMKEIAKNYSSGYTDITRKQLNKLRDRYNLRNSNVEPRMFTFIKQNGVNLSVWYLTNAYATLALRSNISLKIVESFNSEPDIEIAYPTETVRIYQRERGTGAIPIDLDGELK
jgi:small-conductance mechanosensitive channel